MDGLVHLLDMAGTTIARLQDDLAAALARSADLEQANAQLRAEIGPPVEAPVIPDGVLLCGD